MKLIYSTEDQPFPFPPFLTKFNNIESFQTFRQSTDKDRVIFYYSIHRVYDEQNLEFWKYLKDHSSINLIYDLHGEPASRQTIYEIKKLLQKYNVKKSQLIIIVLDEYQRNFVKTLLEEYFFNDVTVSIWNHWLNSIKVDPISNYEEHRLHKFSFLLRRYSAWRLCLSIELLKRNVLWNNFSFSSLALAGSCANTLTSVPVNTIKEDLKTLNISIDSVVEDYLKKIPLYHNCDYADIDVEANDENKLINLIKTSDFHIIIEKSYVHDYFSIDDHKENMFNDGRFVSEKTYRTLIANRPFIVYSSCNWLKNFKRLGFKTYSPVINEDYDNEVDNAKRLTMIVDEVERICKLPADEYAALVKECQLIADYNYNLVMELYNKEQNINLEQVLCKV
jgi:hypothetical protein